ncbi:MAG: uroporphyrinogen decarboxylase family protein [Candidatus Aminicenantes bacterium]|nr:uroporphyrinogen decarboxylase family protein [Candidatus Aminicenantes bacterium]
MNGRERILAALRGEWPDRVPIMLHNFMLAARENGVPMSRFRRDGRAVAESFIRAVETYGYDGVLVDIDTVTLAGAAGVPVDLPEDLPARARGALLGSLDEVRDLEPVRIEEYPAVRAALDAVALLKDYFRGEVAVRGNCDQAPFALAALMRGVEDWLLDLTQAEEALIVRLLSYCTTLTGRFLELMAGAGADILSNGDSPAGPDVISPGMYRTYAQPWEERVVEMSRRLGRPYILHICGDARLILPDMIATGADGLELDQKTDIPFAHVLMKHRTTFVGNLDPSGVLAWGTKALVRTKTRELVEAFADTPRFILNAGCAIPAETPSENLRAMIDTARAFR